MEKNTIIKKLVKYDRYAYYQPIGCFKELVNAKTEANIFGTQVALCISSEFINDYVWFGIANDIFNTKKIRLGEDDSFFNSIEVDEILEDFDFQLKDNIFLFEEHNYDNAYLLFQWCLGKIYLMIYATRRTRDAQSPAEDYYGDDILYVHGVWEVELSEEFKKKLYYV